MPGPAPKHPSQRARRNPTVAMTSLPAAGRPGRAPKWPLGVDIELETGIELAKNAIAAEEHELEWASTARDRTACRRRIESKRKQLAKLEALARGASRLEREIWTQLWKTPQATQWEKRGYLREVALYARHQAKGECGSLDDSKEARQREDRLGLNDMAMLRLRWEVAPPAEQKKTGGRRARPTRYGGLRVVGK